MRRLCRKRRTMPIMPHTTNANLDAAKERAMKRISLRAIAAMMLVGVLGTGGLQRAVQGGVAKVLWISVAATGCVAGEHLSLEQAEIPAVL